MTDKMADQILKELEQSNRLVAELVKAVERQNEILDEKLDDIAALTRDLEQTCKKLKNIIKN